MTMKPTRIIGTAPAESSASFAELASMPVSTSETAIVPYNPPASFPVRLDPTEMTEVNRRLGEVNIVSTPLRDIATMGNECELALGRTLDGFLGRVDKLDNPQIYKLFTALAEKVDENKLPDLANRIIENKPTFWEGLGNMLSSAKGRKKAAERAWEELQHLVSGKTKTLVDLVRQKELELIDEQKKLDGEIAVFEQLKSAYRTSFRDFAVTVAFMQAFLERARAEVAAAKAKADLNDPTQKAEMDELESKLQALESRALALEGGLTRLPADQVMIKQLETAGVQTLQETTTTATARFNSIKMTLVALNGTMAIKSVQRVAEVGATLDAQLAKVQSNLAKEVVTTAANAPGDNRLQQAKMINDIVEDTKALQNIVETARQNNTAKFADTRVMLDTARKNLLAVGQQVQPGNSVQR